MNQIFVAFLTGLTTGGLSCFAVQGGLLAGLLLNKDTRAQKKILLLFLVSKLIAHFVLGSLLGLLGSILIISTATQGIMQIFSGVVIIIMALKFSDIHPIFRRFSITPPKFIFRILRTKSKDLSVFSAIIVGLMTIFIPCGITQSIMLLSVSSVNFWYGGLILGAFILGTTPIFYILGLTSEMILTFKPLKFIAVITMLYLGLSAINGGQILRGSIHTFQNYESVLFNKNIQVKGTAIKNDGRQIVTIIVKNSGYEASVNTLKINVPVKLILKTDNTFGCARSFTIPTYNIRKMLPTTGSEEIEFTPNKLGNLTFTCSMGMYSGSFNVVE